MPSPNPKQSPWHALQQLLILAWPIIISRSTQVVIGLSDATMTGQLGEAALAATTTGAFNAFTAFILPMGMVFIVSSFAAQYFGQGNLTAARRYAYYGLILAAAAEALCLLAALYSEGLMVQSFYAPEVQKLLGLYLKWRLISGGAVVGMEALGNFYGGLGNTRLPMVMNVLAMVLNLFLNWVLIFGHCGAPAMGVAGSALASSVATAVAFVLLLGCFLRGVGMGPMARERAVLQASEMFNFLRYGVPNGLNWFFEFAAFTFFINVVVADLGTTVLAAFMAVFQINSVSFMPAFGLASANAILVGQSLGAGDKDAVPGLTYRCLGIACLWEGAVGLLYFIAPAVLLALFVAGQEADEFRLVGAQMLMFSASWQIFDATINTLAEALRAAGDTAFCLWARTALSWGLFVPSSMLVVFVWRGGTGAAVACLVLYMACLAAVLLWRFRSAAWRHIEITHTAGP